MKDILKWSLGIKTKEYTSFWMERGKKLEEEARNKYEKKKNKKVIIPNFIFNKVYRCGCYADGLIDDGCIEIKCPKEKNHLLTTKKKNFPLVYHPQIQGTLLITNLDWIDFVSYHPDHEIFIKRVTKNTAYIQKLIIFLKEFNCELEEKYKEIVRFLL